MIKSASLLYLESLVDMYSPQKTGLDAICRSLREGRKVCLEVAHYFRLRSKAEYEYTKALFNCSKTMVLKDDPSPFYEWWNELKSQTEVTANAHAEAGDNYSSLADELTIFSEEQSKLAQTTEENIKSGSAVEKAEFRKALVYRSYYEERRKMFANATETYNVLKRFVTTPKKDLEKSKQKQERLHKEKEAAGYAYGKAIERFVDFCKMWEPRMEKSYKDLEDLEVHRLQTLRNKLWKSTNIDSLTALQHDECCEKVRQNLEQCNLFVDLKEIFMSKKLSRQNSDASSGSPIAQSTPKQHRQLLSLFSKGRGLVIDEFGYASADGATSSTQDNSRFSGDPDSFSSTSSQFLPESVTIDSDTTVLDDFGYATVKDVHRQSVSTITDSEKDTQNADISMPTVQTSPSDHPKQPSVTVTDNEIDLTVKSGLAERNCSTNRPPDAMHSRSYHSLEDMTGSRSVHSISSLDIETWKDDYGYASVKDIRRRKHSALKERQRLKPPKAVNEYDDLIPPRGPLQEISNGIDTDRIHRMNNNPNAAVDDTDDRSTWL